MAVRVRNSATLNFGVMAGSVSVSHVRFQKASGTANPVVTALGSAVTATAGNGFRVNVGGLNVVYPNGETTNAHMKALVDGYWENTSMQIDLMTDSTTVVADSGYSAATTSGWTITTE